MKGVSCAAVVTGLCLCLKLRVCSNFFSQTELQCSPASRTEYFHYSVFIRGASVLLPYVCLHSLHNFIRETLGFVTAQGEKDQDIAFITTDFQDSVKIHNSLRWLVICSSALMSGIFVCLEETLEAQCCYLHTYITQVIQHSC